LPNAPVASVALSPSILARTWPDVPYVTNPCCVPLVLPPTSMRLIWTAGEPASSEK
jgi:hypothetical protein